MPLDIATSTVWSQLTAMEDPELRRLAALLPDTLLSSRADSTTKKYLGAFRRWKAWAEAHQGVPVFPVQEIHLALYLQHLSESARSKAPIEEAVHAISWVQQLSCWTSPSISISCHQVYIGRAPAALGPPKGAQRAYFPSIAG